VHVVASLRLRVSVHLPAPSVGRFSVERASHRCAAPAPWESPPAAERAKVRNDTNSAFARFPGKSGTARAVKKYVKRANVRDVLPLLGLAEIAAGVSGERPVIRTPPNEQSGTDLDRAHMEAARQRGVCVLLKDDVDAAGVREQKSAWLQADGTLVLTAWHQDAEMNWIQGDTFSIPFHEVPELFDLLARNGF